MLDSSTSSTSGVTTPGTWSEVLFLAGGSGSVSSACLHTLTQGTGSTDS